ncbi:hypothetical protein D0T12_01670 [Actinomadura spongiicola]|uniref:Uncharacterized protein n=1 Tax=Actinomadura spongiicola TaxID=2303421 RepID=A0A372GPB1_9ACTN|nr:hypothetical protein D0T12_01670 [Actinomadura spongiicola]
MRFDVTLPAGADVRVASDLRSHLLKSGAEAVEPVRVRHTPSRGRPGEAERPAELVEIAGLAVSFAGDLMQAIDVLGSWLGYRRNAGTDDDEERQVTSIRLEIDGDVIEITNPLLEHERALVELFVRRHGGRVSWTERP